MIWSLEQIPVLKDFLKAVTSEEDVAVVQEVLKDFEENVVPNYDKFTKGIVFFFINFILFFLKNKRSNFMQMSVDIHLHLFLL
jgi:hypothetical protein